MTGTCHWAAPGVRCVCINDDWPAIVRAGLSVPVRLPMIDEVLTVRSIGPGCAGAVLGSPDEIYLTFWEIPVEQADGPLSATGIGWIAGNFRPLVEDATDISVFTGILDRAPADQHVEEPVHAG